MKNSNRKGNLCYFTTFADGITITCSKDGKFDEYGFPVNICKEVSTCQTIKDRNSNIYIL